MPIFNMGYVYTFLCDSEIKSVKQGAKYQFQPCLKIRLIFAKRLTGQWENAVYNCLNPQPTPTQGSFSLWGYP